MKRLWFFLLITTMLVSFSACSAEETAADAQEVSSQTEKTDDVQQITSSVSNLSLNFPKSWSQNNLADGASIQMAHLVKEQYMVVLEENDDDFMDDFTIDDYATIIMETMMSTSETIDNTEIQDVTIGNSASAKQFELSLVIEKMKIKYLVTCAKVDGVFYQFTAWSLQSKYDDAKPVFDDILGSASF